MRIDESFTKIGLRGIFAEEILTKVRKKCGGGDMGNVTASETRELAGVISVLSLAMIALGIAIIPFAVKRMTAAYKLASGTSGWGTVLRTSMILIAFTSVISAFVGISVRFEESRAWPLFPFIVIGTFMGIMVIAGIVMIFMILKSRYPSQGFAESWKFYEAYTAFGTGVLVALSIWYEMFALVSVGGTALGTVAADATRWGYNSGRFLLADAIMFLFMGVLVFGTTYIASVVIRNFMVRDGS